MSYIDDQIESLNGEIEDLDDWLKLYEGIWLFARLCIAAEFVLIPAAVILGQGFGPAFGGSIGGIAGLVGLLGLGAIALVIVTNSAPHTSYYSDGLWNARRARKQKDRERTKLILKREGFEA